KTSTPPEDDHGHGTHVASVIYQVAEGAILGYPGLTPVDQKRLARLRSPGAKEYCFVIVKYYTARGDSSGYVKAIKHIEKIPGPKIVNISGGGKEKIQRELTFISMMHRQHARVIAAA